MAQSEFVEVAKVNEIPPGKMKHVEFNRRDNECKLIWQVLCVK